MNENQYIEKPPSRVTVLDAVQLDNEIEEICKDQLSTIIKFLPPGLLSSYEPELELILKATLWQLVRGAVIIAAAILKRKIQDSEERKRKKRKLSVGKMKSTFGQQLLKLRYPDSTSLTKLKLFGFLVIFIPYAKERSDIVLNKFLKYCNKDKFKKRLEMVENVIKSFEIITFLLFLRGGGSPTVIEKFLGLEPVSVSPVNFRNIGYYFMTRELIWHGFVELLMFTIPLINYRAFKRKLRSIFVKKEHASLTAPSTYTESTRCSVCHQVPILPHHMGCEHAFCYYCLASNREEDIKFECPDCGFSDSSESALKPVY